MVPDDGLDTILYPIEIKQIIFSVILFAYVFTNVILQQQHQKAGNLEFAGI